MKTVAVWIAALAILGTGSGLAGANVWTSLGPGGGSIKAVVIDPQNPRTLYAGTFVSGVFKSTDAGASWSAASVGLPLSLLLATLAIDPQNTSTLYALTGYPEGLFKSTNGAASWSAVTLPDHFYTQTIAIDSLSTVYIGGSVSPGPSSYPALFKTTDDGVSWDLVPLPEHFYVNTIAIDAQNQNTLYLGGNVYAGDPGTAYAAVFKTTDGGANWGAGSRLPSRVDGIPVLVIDPQDPSTIYAGTSGSGVFKSTDGGASWSAINSGFPLDFTRTLALAIDPAPPSAIYAVMSFSGASGKLPQGGCCAQPGSLFKSIDGGASWSEINSGLTRAAFDPIVDGDFGPLNVGLAVDPQTPGAVYVGTNDAGVFKSTDGGARWSPANTGLAAVSVGKPVIDPNNPDTIYVADWTRIYKSTDAGISWSAGDWGVPALYVRGNGLVIDRQKSGTIYAGSPTQEDGAFRGGVFKTTDGGKSWSDANSRSVLGLCCIETLVIDPQNSDTVYAGTDEGVIKTIDGGQTWAEATAGVPGGALTSHPPVYSIVINPQDPKTIYTAGNRAVSGPIFKSTDAGASWSAASSGIPAAFYIGWLVIDSQTPSTVYGYGSNGYEQGPSRSRLFQTTDSGASWKEFNFGLPADAIDSLLPLVFDPRNPGTIYAGTAKGVLFRSTDGGTSWSTLSSELPGSTLLWPLTIDPKNPNRFYAGTNGGVFAITLAP